MRSRVWIVAIVLFSLASVLHSEDVQVVKDSEAAKFVGKNVEVRGQVVSCYIGKRGDTYIFFGAVYPNQTFTGYIPAGWTFSGGAWTLKLKGQVISVIGTVEIYKGKPEIKNFSMDKNKQLDTRPKSN